MEGVIRAKENGQHTDAVRATYQDLVMMGVGINNTEQVVHTVLTSFTNIWGWRWAVAIHGRCH